MEEDRLVFFLTRSKKLNNYCIYITKTVLCLFTVLKSQVLVIVSEKKKSLFCGFLPYPSRNKRLYFTCHMVYSVFDCLLKRGD